MDMLEDNLGVIYIYPKNYLKIIFGWL